MNIHPVNPGPVPVVPVGHAAFLADLPEEDGRSVFTVAQRLAAAAIRQALER